MLRTRCEMRACASGGGLRRLFVCVVAPALGKKEGATALNVGCISRAVVSEQVRVSTSVNFEIPGKTPVCSDECHVLISRLRNTALLFFLVVRAFGWARRHGPLEHAVRLCLVGAGGFSFFYCYH